MAQYIDKDALLAEIDRISKSAEEVNDSSYVFLCNHLKSFLNTLEVKEVDLELTWEDISKIREILCGTVGYPLMSDKEVCTEVLKRFRAQKGE